MAKMTPQQIAEKQIRRAQEASGDYVAGINATTVNPMQEAKKKKDKLKANFNAAVDSGKWEAGLDSVSAEEWKRQSAEVGGARFGSGVEAARGKIVAFQEEVAPHRARIQAEVRAMPDTTPEQRLARMMANARGMAQFKRQRRRR